jgi:hypothetical protein
LKCSVIRWVSVAFARGWIPATGADSIRTWFSTRVAESTDKQDASGSKRSILSPQAIGWAFILLILAGYFAWMTIEMGAHAVTHAWPMLGVFVAAIAGGLAATLGLLIGRRGGS